MQVKGAVIAITGGAQGLGKAMALNLAAQGAKLALIDLDEDKRNKGILISKITANRLKAALSVLIIEGIRLRNVC